MCFRAFVSAVAADAFSYPRLIHDELKDALEGSELFCEKVERASHRHKTDLFKDRASATEFAIENDLDTMLPALLSCCAVEGACCFASLKLFLPRPSSISCNWR